MKSLHLIFFNPLLLEDGRVHRFHLELDALSPFVLSFIARNERFLESSEANAQLSTMSREDGNETHLRGLLPERHAGRIRVGIQ